VRRCRPGSLTILTAFEFRKSFARFCAGLLFAASIIHFEAHAESRSIPHPLPSHPGNVFVAGEDILIKLPSAQTTWKLLNYEGITLKEGRTENEMAQLGRLPVGYYEIKTSESARISLGILEPLHALTPTNSPVGIDVAMAWFFPKEKMDEVANLCALAGMNRVRDRLGWEQMEPKRGEFAAHNQYDDSAEIQSKAGLQILQVSHISASWANPHVTHFPPDLRDIHDFYREMAKRWRNEVVAFEPWNEADIKMFGGHTGSEMASLQKAAYLGLKAGNSNVIACLNVFAIRRAATLSDFNNNETWPYFDTFNLHHYEPLKNYPALYSDFRAISAGKPMWVSECSVHIKWSGDEKLKELSDEDARLQSVRLTKTYALAIYQGAAAVFYFMLPHYTEGKLQYGILRSDLTPRPAYVAAAAVGHLLAGAKPRGRIEIGDKAGQAYCFSAEPDGKPADVLLAWANTNASFELPSEPSGCFDHLGRTKSISGKSVSVGPSPIFVVLKKGTLSHVIPPPKPAPLLSGEPIPLLLQALLPENDIILEKSAYKMEAGKQKRIPLFLYNFGNQNAEGKLTVNAPLDWKAQITSQITAKPGERKETILEVEYSGSATSAQADIRVTGNFGSGGNPILALRLAIE